MSAGSRMKDTDLLVPLSIDYNGTLHSITYRPPSEDFQKDWGQKILDGWREYLLLDPTSETGRDSIARFNGWEREWEEKISSHDDNTPVCDIIFDLALMYADKGSKTNAYFCFSEGQHRLGGVIQALTGRQLRSVDGVIERDALLTYETFTRIGLVPSKDLPTDFDIQNCVQTALSSTELPLFLSRSVNVRTNWITDSEVTVSSITGIQRILSEARSDSKRTSVVKKALPECATYLKDTILRVNRYSHLYRPDTSRDAIPTPIFEKGAKAASKLLLEAGNKEDVAFPNMPFLFSSTYEDYMKDPRDRENSEAVYKHFSYLAKGKKNLLLTPPYPNTHKSLALDPTPQVSDEIEDSRTTHPSTWQINAFIMMPVLIHILMAEKMNITLAQASKDETVHKLVKYATRYHVVSKGLPTISTHGAFTAVYGNNATDILLAPPTDIIAVALFMTECANTALSFILGSSDGRSITAREFTNNINSAAHMNATLFATLHLKAPTLNLLDVAQDIGKAKMTLLCYYLQFVKYLSFHLLLPYLLLFI